MPNKCIKYAYQLYIQYLPYIKFNSSKVCLSLSRIKQNLQFPGDHRVHVYGKPFYYLLGNVDILFIYKISYKVYKISNVYQISYILY